MMSDVEIAWLLLQILHETRTYAGVQFARAFASGAVRIKYAKALFLALPEHEQIEVEEMFDQIYSAVAAARVAATYATHQAQETMQ